MLADPVLVNDWHPVARSSAVLEGGIVAARLLGEDIILWRAEGHILAWQDLCIHRGTRLSLGTVTDDNQLKCPYHGWSYNTEGHCTLIPAHPEQKPPTKAKVKTFS